MDNVLIMQVVDAQTYLDESFPNEVVYQSLPILFLDEALEVSMLAELHYDIDISFFNERV